MLCGENLYPESFYDGGHTSDALASNNTKTTRYPSDLINQISDAIYPKWLSAVRRFLDPRGIISVEEVDMTVQGIDIKTAALVGDDMITIASNTSRSLPMLHSLFSLPQTTAQAAQDGTTTSEFFSMHYGSLAPDVQGSLVLDGYDDNRIQGDLMNISTDEDEPGLYLPLLSIARLYIGVEHGFLPLKTLANNNNNSYPQGPFKVDPRHLTLQTWSDLSSITIEPSSPYPHLPLGLCEPLAALLDLTYDPSRNLYLWNHPADHPIFHSPVYLELDLAAVSSFKFVSRNHWGDATRAGVTVKIPLAQLQHTFAATTIDPNGTEVPAGQRYFPCAPTGFESAGSSGGYSHYKAARLGRAFLQTEFVGANFHFLEDYPASVNTLAGTPQLWLAQAPGPSGDQKPGTEDLVVVDESGSVPNRTNVTLPLYAWTKSWDSVLPVWTLDSDGVTTLDELNARVSDRGSSQSRKIGLQVGVPIWGVVVLGLLGWMVVLATKRSRRKWARIRREIAGEDATAREIERLVASSREKEMVLLDSEGLRPYTDQDPD